jgi:serine/threonine protein kinase
VSRLFQSLTAGLRTLDKFYTTVELVTNPLATRLFPHVDSYATTEGEVQFRYLSKLLGNCREKAVFKAQIQSQDLLIVVKFTNQYNEAAHQILAREGLAPRLLYVGDTYKSIPEAHGICGASKMVVMEHLPGSSAHQLLRTGSLSSPSFQDVKRAINALHKNGIVFGDLRRPNIMLYKDGAKIVDFDWCGEHGVGTYPYELNREISWHPDVEGGSVMYKEHDDFMLERLRPKEIGEDI